MDAFGPVIVDKASPHYIGARGLTNNTGEMSAVVEFLLWILSQPPGEIDKPVVVHCDSKYAIGMLTGKFRARENIELARLLVHLWSLARDRHQLFVQWVKGHCQCHGNEFADKSAKRGCDISDACAWWTRPFRLREWAAERFTTDLLEDLFTCFAPRPSDAKILEDCPPRVKDRHESRKGHQMPRASELQQGRKKIRKAKRQRQKDPVCLELRALP